jgi:hypothetical protein
LAEAAGMNVLSDRGGVLRETRGAIYVEFLIAFLPVFTFFLCMLQLSLLFSARLIVEHAAMQGVRAAAVVFGDEPSTYGESADDTNTMTKNRRKAVRNAVLLSLAPLILDNSVSHVDVLFPAADQPGGKDQDEGTKISPMTLSGTQMVRVRVEATVRCKISLADAIICKGATNDALGFLGLARVLVVKAESIFPYQGASYAYKSE